MGLFDSIERLASGLSDMSKQIQSEKSPLKEQSVKPSSQGRPQQTSSEYRFPSELEQFIDITLEDGVLSDKELSVLYKKAAKYDIDPDELDIILESRLKKIKSTGQAATNEENQTRGSNKTKGPKKCPACGATLLDPDIVFCPDCGYKVVNIVKDILEELNSVVPRKKEKKTRTKGLIEKGFEALFGSDEEDENGIDEEDLIEQKSNIILNYTIPNTKETVLEFLAFSLQKSHSTTWAGSGYKVWDDDLGEAWYGKSEQVIAKARETFREDAAFLERLTEYAIKFGMEVEKKKGLFRR